MINIRSGFMYLTCAYMIFMVSGYMVNIWLARELGPETYGVYGVVISIMNSINVILTTGIPRAASKFISESIYGAAMVLRTALNAQLSLALIISVSIYFLSHPISIILNSPNLDIFIKMTAAIFPGYAMFTLYMNYYNGLHAFRRQAIMHVSYSISKMIGVVILSIKYGLYGVFIGFMIAPIIALLIGFKVPVASSTFPYKKLLVFSMPMVAFAIVSSLQMTIDLFFVKASYPGGPNTGYYAAIQNIAYIPFYGLSAFAAILLPGVSKIMADGGEIHDLIKNTTRSMLIFLVPATIVIMSASRGVVELLYSETYVPAAEPLEILVLGISLLTLFVAFANIISGAGKPYMAMWLAIIGLLVTASSCALLISSFGLMGAAIATLIGSATSLIIASIYMFRLFGYGLINKHVIFIVIAGTVSYIVSFLLRMGDVHYIMVIISTISVYLLSLITFGVISRKAIKQNIAQVIARVRL